jgi:hypothetical protein
VALRPGHVSRLLRLLVLLCACNAAPVPPRPGAFEAALLVFINTVALSPVCSLVGCHSAVSFVVHLDDPPAFLDGGTLRVCHQDECWDAEFSTFSERYPEPVRLHCTAHGAAVFSRECDVGPEGTGSIVHLRVASRAASEKGPGGFRDGDKVSLQIDAGGRRLVDHTRYVLYDDHYPNGVFCSPRCRGAAVELWPGATSGVTCGNGVCKPIVRFEADWPVTREGAGKTTLTVCRNGDCKANPLVLWRWDEATGKEKDAMNGGGGSLGQVAGAEVSLTVRSGRGKASAIAIELRGDTRAYAPGDRYRVEWQSEKGEVLFVRDEIVSAYDEEIPGGQGCSPVVCRTKTFRY